MLCSKWTCACMHARTALPKVLVHVSLQRLLQCCLAEWHCHGFFATGPLERGMVSCTGSQFCGFGLVETKNRAMRIVAALEAQLNIPKTVRMHWTGCPNSCGQAQV